MANVDAPFGLRPVISPGGDNGIQMREYEVDSAYTTAIYEGALVMLAADGTVVLWTATNKVLGVAAQYRAGAATSANTTMLVYDDPDQQFVIQSDDNTLVDNGDIQGIGFGISADANRTNADGTAATGLSTMELDGASGGTVSLTKVLYGIRPSRAIDDDVTLANNKVIVKIAPGAHELSGVIL